jgi:hypothetical protein
MPSDGPDGGKKVAHSSVDEQGFSGLLPYPRSQQSCFGSPESPKLDKSQKKLQIQ